MKKISLCYLAAGLLLAALITSCGGSGTSIISKTPSDVIKASIDDLNNQKFSNFITYYVRKDSVVFTKQDTAKMSGLCTLAYEEAKKKQGIKEVQIIEEKIAPDGNSANVKYKIVFKDGSENNSDETLRKVNGNWLIVIGG
ncbi:MAG: DUF4878 domain-containing protein [bacterium]